MSHPTISITIKDRLFRGEYGKELFMEEVGVVLDAFSRIHVRMEGCIFDDVDISEDEVEGSQALCVMKMMICMTDGRRDDLGELGKIHARNFRSDVVLSCEPCGFKCVIKD